MATIKDYKSRTASGFGYLFGFALIAAIPLAIITAFAVGGMSIALLTALMLVLLGFLGSRKVWTSNEKFPWFLVPINLVKWAAFTALGALAYDQGGTPLLMVVAITTGFTLHHSTTVMEVEVLSIELSALTTLRERLEVLEQKAGMKESEDEGAGDRGTVC